MKTKNQAVKIESHIEYRKERVLDY